MKMTRKEAIRIAVLLAIMGIIIHFLIMNGFGNILSIKVINGDVNDCYFELYNVDDTPIDTSSYKITVKDNTPTKPHQTTIASVQHTMPHHHFQ